MTWFRANPAAAPDPTDFEVVDYGQGVRLGDFDVAARTILFEFDAEFRRRKKATQIEMDDSLGGSLRRLRLMKGIKQKDFSSVNPRTIRRIESGEVEPRPSTLESIARELGVQPEEISSY